MEQTRSDLLNEITKRKRRQVDFVRWLRHENEKMAEKVTTCGSWLLIREYVAHDVAVLRNANFCKKHTLCEGCAKRRGMRLAMKYAEKAGTVLSERPTLIPAHVTLTITNTETAAEGVATIKRAFAAMMAARRKALSGSYRHQAIEWNKVDGGIRGIEATNKGNGWHVHLHVFCLLTDYIDPFHLSAEWERFNEGTGSIVHVERIRAKDTQNTGKGESDPVVSALLEVIKYPTKFDDLEHPQRWELHQAFKRTRLTDPFGSLRGVVVVDIDADEDPELDGEVRHWQAMWDYRKRGFDLTPTKPTELDLSIAEVRGNAKRRAARTVAESA